MHWLEYGTIYREGRENTPQLQPQPQRAASNSMSEDAPPPTVSTPMSALTEGQKSPLADQQALINALHASSFSISMIPKSKAPPVYLSAPASAQGLDLDNLRRAKTMGRFFHLHCASYWTVKGLEVQVAVAHSKGDCIRIHGLTEYSSMSQRKDRETAQNYSFRGAKSKPTGDGERDRDKERIRMLGKEECRRKSTTGSTDDLARSTGGKVPVGSAASGLASASTGSWRLTFISTGSEPTPTSKLPSISIIPKPTSTSSNPSSSSTYRMPSSTAIDPRINNKRKADVLGDSEGGFTSKRRSGARAEARSDTSSSSSSSKTHEFSSPAPHIQISPSQAYRTRTFYAHSDMPHTFSV
ncbi:hypothetical protein EDB19DRAFT_1837137 [Suillus lakei]|nr:hypothetical protein EDB19DRAFT_1837137 [Suillus lakei]